MAVNKRTSNKRNADSRNGDNRDNSVGDAPRQFAIDRRVLARLCSGIGGLALVVGILALLLQHTITPLSVISILIGAVGIVLWTMLAPDDLRGMLTGRNIIYGGNSILSIILVIGIVAIGYTLTMNSGVAADLTTLGYYSLKKDAKEIVTNLSRPIQITSFYNSSALDARELDMPILRMFADAAPDKIKLVIVDPDEKPLVAKSFNFVGSTGIFVSYLDASGNPDQAYTVQSKGNYAREQWIAEAILQLEARGKYRILFTIGHDEMDTNLETKGDAYAIRLGAESVGVQTGTIDLRTQDIPANTSALIMLRPQREFDKSEVDKIAAYMANGGKMLIMAKPAYVPAFQFMNTPDSQMNAYLWQNWGIRPQNDIVFDPVNYVENPYRVLASQVSAHPIMKRDAANTTSIRPLLHLPESWEINAKPPNQVTITPLIYSSPQAVGKKNLPEVGRNPDAPSNLQKQEGDLSGPLVLAAALENQQTNARLIVVGDADWVYSDNITSYDGQFFWTNMVDWLTKYLTNITVQPRIKELPLIADTASLNIVVLISLVILPGLVLVTGGLVWWDRLRRQ